MGSIIDFIINKKEKELHKQQAMIAAIKLDNTVSCDLEDFVILGRATDGADVELIKSNSLQMVQYAGQVIAKLTTTMEDMEVWEREAIRSELQCMLEEVKMALKEPRSWK